MDEEGPKGCLCVLIGFFVIILAIVLIYKSLEPEHKTMEEKIEEKVNSGNYKKTDSMTVRSYTSGGSTHTHTHSVVVYE